MILQTMTRYGEVEGVPSPTEGIAIFKGVPFAKPPVGELRWRAPRDPESWEGVRVCDTYGPACAQFDRWDVAVDDVTDGGTTDEGTTDEGTTDEGITNEGAR